MPEARDDVGAVEVDAVLGVVPQVLAPRQQVGGRVEPVDHRTDQPLEVPPDALGEPGDLEEPDVPAAQHLGQQPQPPAPRRRPRCRGGRGTARCSRCTTRGDPRAAGPTSRRRPRPSRRWSPSRARRGAPSRPAGGSRRARRSGPPRAGRCGRRTCPRDASTVPNRDVIGDHVPVGGQCLDDRLPHPLVVREAVHEEHVRRGGPVAVLGDAEGDRRGDQRGHL